MKFAVSAAVVLMLATAGLAGCNHKSETPSPSPTTAAPEAPAGLSVTDGRLILPPVSGNPGVVYFDIANNGDADATIAGVNVDGAKSAMLHTTIESGGMSSMKSMASIAIPQGQTVKFAPGGNHVMAMDLDPSLKPGGTTEITLTFASGDKVSFNADIRAPGAER